VSSWLVARLLLLLLALLLGIGPAAADEPIERTLVRLDRAIASDPRNPELGLARIASAREEGAR
jgi:hypothetical protein